MKAKFKYTIDRSKWVCGNSGATFDEHDQWAFPELGEPNMQNLKGKRCCLGIICGIEGVPEKVLKGCYEPSDVADYDEARAKMPDWMYYSNCEEADGDDYYYNSDVVNNMMEVNDDYQMDQTARESRLIELAATVGVELEFVGELDLNEED